MYNLKPNWRDCAGYSICVGFAMMRFWSGHVSNQRIELATAMLLIDLGVVIYLEKTARSLKAEHLYHLRCKEENDRLDRRLNAARVREMRLKTHLGRHPGRDRGDRRAYQGPHSAKPGRFPI